MLEKRRALGPAAGQAGAPGFQRRPARVQATLQPQQPVPRSSQITWGRGRLGEPPAALLPRQLHPRARLRHPSGPARFSPRGSPAGASPRRGRGPANRTSHVRAPRVTRSPAGVSSGLARWLQWPEQGWAPGASTWLARAPRAARPWRPRLCASLRGAALLTLRAAEPRRPASRRSRVTGALGNVALLHPRIAFG